MIIVDVQVQSFMAEAANMYAGMIEEFYILATLVADFVNGCLVGNPILFLTESPHVRARGFAVWKLRGQVLRAVGP